MSVLPTRPLESVGDALLARTRAGRFPLSGQFELTCRCNLKCQMCYTDPFNTPERVRQELSTDEVIRILDELQEAGCLELTLTGGEPLARPDFRTIYEAAHSRGFLLTVFTNATLITEEIADLWIAHPPRMVEISLHGVSAGVFERVTQISGSFQHCHEAIERLRLRRIPMTLKTVAMTLNKDEVLAVKRYVDSLGSNVHFMLGEYLRDDLAISGLPYQYQLAEQDLGEIERQEPVLVKEKEHDVQSRHEAIGNCSSGQVSFHIDAYGQLQLCSGNRRGGYDLRHGSFSEGFFDVLPTLPCPNRSERPQQSKTFIPLPVLQEVS
jgi:MoaA/NifB/PqqE/SkfB family radical SAM enzyme